MGNRRSIDVFIGAKVQLQRVLVLMHKEELARSVGITEQALEAYERGEERFPPRVLLDVAKALGQKLSELIQGIETLAADQAPFPDYETPEFKASQQSELCSVFASLPAHVRHHVLEYVKSLLD